MLLRNVFAASLALTATFAIAQDGAAPAPVPPVVPSTTNTPTGKPTSPSTDATSAPAAAPFTTADEVVAAFETRGNALSDAEFAAAAPLIDAAATADSSAAKWKYAKAVLAAHARDFKVARNLMREVVKAETESAVYHMTHAGYTFMSINDAGTLDQMSLAEEGRDAYIEALRIDSTLIEPRIGLAEFYIQAPGIAGGSWKKANEQAQALIDLPDGRGQFYGYMMKARIAAERDRWKEMSENFTLAETAQGEEASPFVAMISHANALLDKKEDAKAALVQAERALPLAPATDYTVHAVMGRCKQSLKDWQGAADSFAQVLAIKPDAKLSRLGYATALEKLGKQTEALQHYREFVTRFPSDDLTEKAKDGIARLNRAGIR